MAEKSKKPASEDSKGTAAVKEDSVTIEVKLPASVVKKLQDWNGKLDLEIGVSEDGKSLLVGLARCDHDHSQEAATEPPKPRTESAKKGSDPPPIYG